MRTAWRSKAGVSVVVEVDGAGDHRCAMSFAVLGQVASGQVRVTGAENINTSFPSFVQDLTRVGA